MTMLMTYHLVVALLLVLVGRVSSSFLPVTTAAPRAVHQHQIETAAPTLPARHQPFVSLSSSPSALAAAASDKVTEKEASVGINKVVAALRKDATAKSELGNLEKVTIVLGYGAPTPGLLNVRFNASFRKSGKGLSSVPLPFGLGQTNVSEGRGTMVGQVKATIDSKTGKVTSCSVFRDLGYGRSFNLKV
jgi:hypothetical protein